MNYDNMTVNEILANMFELCKTPEGKDRVKHAAIIARIAYGVHQIFRYLHEELQVFRRDLSYIEQQNVCNIVSYAILNAKHGEIMDFINSIPPTVIEELDDTVGSC